MVLKSKPLCVGLTGGIGSGKSTVCNFFAELGASIIDSDVIAREVSKPGTMGHQGIVERFGEQVLTAGRVLDRKKLRQIIFNDPEMRIWLENLLHPLIINSIRSQIRLIDTPYCIIVIPLLAESRFPIDFLDRVCVIDTLGSISRQRAAKRDNTSLANINDIIESQTSREKRLALADDIIVNNNDLVKLEKQVKKLHERYLQLSSS